MSLDLLGYDAVTLGEWTLAFQRNMVPSFLWDCLTLEGEGNTFIGNIKTHCSLSDTDSPEDVNSCLGLFLMAVLVVMMLNCHVVPPESSLA